MKINNRVSLTTFACGALLLGVILLHPATIKAQWTTPDGNQNINNTNTGNVGVGKTSPAYKLDLLSSINVIARFDSSASDHTQVLINAASGYNANLTLQRAGVAKWYLANNASDDRFAFANASGSQVVTISQSGKLGVGTTSAQDAIHIFDASGVGSLRIQGGSNVAGFVSVWDFGPMLLLSNNRNPLTGNNFKTTVPGAQILVGAPTAPEDIGFYTISSGTVGNATELVRMKANGRVGIGTITPGFKLDVQGGSINSSGGLCIAGDCKTAWSQVGGSSQWTNGSGGAINYAGGNVGVGVGTPTTKLDVAGTVNASAFTVGGTNVVSSQWANGSGGVINYAGGNVGVGVPAPTTKLDVAGTVNASAFTVGGSNVVSSQWTNASGNINYATGNVGIATAAPTEKLHVTGNVKVVGNIDVTGNIKAKYQDIAEWVQSSQDLSAGTVVILDPARSNQVIASTDAYDSRVAGVVSEQPGLALGEDGEGRVLVATTGRVKVKVDAANGPINIGDLLVTSDKSGVAMKSLPVEVGGLRIHRPGTLIGKALEPFASGTGEILVLLSLQ